MNIWDFFIYPKFLYTQCWWALLTLLFVEWENGKDKTAPLPPLFCITGITVSNVLQHPKPKKSNFHIHLTYPKELPFALWHLFRQETIAWSLPYTYGVCHLHSQDQYSKRNDLYSILTITKFASWSEVSV